MIVNDNVVALAADTAALFFSINDPPQTIGVTVCSDRTLNTAIAAAVFGGDVDTPDARDEVSRLVATLRESGHVEFDDGWLQLCVGVRAIVVFLMAQIRSAREDARYADQLRAAEHIRAAAVGKKYNDLRAALIEALGDRAPAIVQRAAADIIAGAAASG